MAGVTSVVIDGTTYLVDDINAVDFSEDQGLSEQQQEQGRSNIGAAAETELEGKADETDLNALAGTVGELSDDVEGLTEALADKASAIVDTASGAIASFPDGAAVAAKDITIGIEPVQAGSGDPSPTNVRPISGWTGANVTRTGKNMLPLTVEILKAANQSGTWSGNNYSFNGITFTIKTDNDGNLTGINVNGTANGNSDLKADFYSYPAGSYALNGCPNGGEESTFYTIVGTSDLRLGVDSGNGATFTTDGSLSIRIIIRIFSGYSANNLLFLPMIRKSTDSATYAPYSGIALPISWQSEAGTVYGGTLDVTTGLLTVDVEIYQYTGNENWFTSSDYRFYIVGQKEIIRCNQYRVLETKVDYASEIPSGAIGQAINGVVYISDERFNGSNEWKAHLSDLYNSGTPLKVIRKLATPQTYQLTPTEVEMLLGENNVWADTGDSTVTYRADTKLYIQKINAPTDDDMIADAQIASGRYFIVGGNLYKSTTTIPAGDTITPGTNCILTSLADALNALNT